MRRKLILQGVGGHTIYLPKNWVDAHKLTKNDSVKLEVLEQGILVTPEVDPIPSETTITLVNHTETGVRTLITNSYRTGYDRVIVQYENESQLDILEKTIQTRLMGFELTEKHEKYCIVESVSEPSQEQFENLFRKIFFNITEMFSVLERALKKTTKPDVEVIAANIQKYDNFCKRVIAKNKLRQRSEMLQTFLAILVHAQRELYYLSKLLPVQITPATKSLFKRTEKIFLLLKKAYFKRDIHCLGKIHEIQKEAFYSDGYQLLQSTNKEETIIVYHLMASLRQFYQANSPLSGALIQ